MVIVISLCSNSLAFAAVSCRVQGPFGNSLAVHVESGNPDVQRDSWQAALYIAAGRDPFQLVDASVAAAAAIAGGVSWVHGLL